MAAAHKWKIPSDNTIVVLDGGTSEDQLWDVLCLLDPKWHPDGHINEDDYVYFLEPDLDNQITGFAIRPGLTPKWLSKRPLLFAKEVNYK